MESAFSLDKVFYEQINEKMTSLGYKYVRKYKMFMKVANDILLKYFYLEKLSMTDKDSKSFILSGNIRSFFADSFDKKNLMLRSMRNNSFIDIKMGFKNEYPKEYCCNIFQIDEVMKQSIIDFENGLLKEIDTIESFKEYIDYCHLYNHRQISRATKFECDSLALIVSDDHDDMKGKLHSTFTAFEQVDGKESAERQYPLFHRAIVELVAGERDKVYNNPILYKEALEEAERRKEANTQTLMTLKLI